jgi:hypothetical protein
MLTGNTSIATGDADGETAVIVNVADTVAFATVTLAGPDHAGSP